MTYGELFDIAEDLAEKTRAGIAQIGARVRAMPRDLSLAERVSGGLALKMYASFEALVEDAREGRGEAMHHLKTLCESFIYFFEAAASDQRAAIVLAYAYDERVRRGKDERRPDAALAAEATAKRDALLQGAALPGYIKKVWQVADRHKPHLPDWYAGVYRLACEPAHISDLEDFLPERRALPESESAVRLRRSYEAIYHGIAMVLVVAGVWNHHNELGCPIDIQEIQRRFRGDEDL